MNPYVIMASRYAKRNPMLVIFIIAVVVGLAIYMYERSPLGHLNTGINGFVDWLFSPFKSDKDKKKQKDQGNGFVEQPIDCYAGISDAQAGLYADHLYNSLDMIGTDVKTIESIFDRLSFCDLKLVFNEYGTRKKGLFANKKNLIQHLKSDLNPTNFQTIVVPKARLAGLI